MLIPGVEKARVIVFQEEFHFNVNAKRGQFVLFSLSGLALEIGDWLDRSHTKKQERKANKMKRKYFLVSTHLSEHKSQQRVTAGDSYPVMQIK